MRSVRRAKPGPYWVNQGGRVPEMWVTPFHGLRSWTGQKGESKLSTGFLLSASLLWIQCDQTPLFLPLWPSTWWSTPSNWVRVHPPLVCIFVNHFVTEATREVNTTSSGQLSSESFPHLSMVKYESLLHKTMNSSMDWFQFISTQELIHLGIPRSPTS